MPKFWGEAVRKLRMNWAQTCGLTTAFGTSRVVGVNNHRFFTQLCNNFYPHLYTARKLFFNLLSRGFSPLSTLSITTTTIKIISFNWVVAEVSS